MKKPKVGQKVKIEDVVLFYGSSLFFLWQISNTMINGIVHLVKCSYLLLKSALRNL